MVSTNHKASNPLRHRHYNKVFKVAGISPFANNHVKPPTSQGIHKLPPCQLDDFHVASWIGHGECA